MISHARRSPLALALAGSAALALSACEPGGDERSPGSEPTAQAGAPGGAPAAEEQQPVASIIRSDVAPDPVVDLPPAPLELTIAFPQGSALNDAAEQRLGEVLRSEALAEGWPVVLRGHSDAGGSDAANLRVSHRRAEAVAGWLAEHGVAEDRIRIIAFGEQNPAAPNAAPDGEPDEAGRARNRRVEISIEPPGGPTSPREAVAEQAETMLESAVDRIGSVGQ